MMESMKPLNTKYGFAPNTKPFVYQEVIDLGENNIWSSYFKLVCMKQHQNRDQ